MIKRILYIIILLSFSLSSWGATYNYYFSDDAQGNAVGSDSNSCLSGSPCQTLSKANSMMSAKSSSDIVNLYFDGGDSWDVSGATLEVFSVNTGDPETHILSYGSGRAIFDGGITDFSTATLDGTGNWHRYNRIFHIEVPNCSIENVEVKNVYAAVVWLKTTSPDNGDNFTMSDNVMYNIGHSFINSTGNTENNIVEKNTLYLGMQLWRYDKLATNVGWGQCVSFFSEGYGPYNNNIIRYNLIYDCAGESIAAANGTIEYNVIGDSYSIAIDGAVGDYDSNTTTIRYNFIMMSDWDSSVYDDIDGLRYGSNSSPHGIRIFDEEIGGDNSSGVYNIYGNIVINRNYGLWAFCTDNVEQDLECGNPWGTVRIYNNLFIDNHAGNINIDDATEFTTLTFYNNSSIFYDRTTGFHVDSIAAGGGWTMSNNHYYSVSGTHANDSEFTTNQQTGDPLLPGETVYGIDWDGQTGATYYNNIDFLTHLYLPSGSPLVGAGNTLTTGYISDFLTTGTDFEDVLDGSSAFATADQDTYSPWEIGAMVYSGEDPPDPDPDPSGSVSGADMSGVTIN